MPAGRDVPAVPDVPAVSDVMADANALRKSLSSLDAASLAGEECAALVESLSRIEHACAAARARVAARAAACGVHRGAGYADSAEWLARVGGMLAHQARVQLETVRDLEACPATRVALEAGSVSLAQAAEIARTERVSAGSEARLLAVAREQSLRALRNEARLARERTVDPDVLAARRRTARRHRHWADELGMVRYSGALLPEDGAPLMHRLDAETKRLANAAEEKQPWECHAADALVLMLRGGGKPQPWRADVVFVIDLPAYRRGRVEGNEVSRIVGGPSVSPSVVRELLDHGDPFVKLAAHNGVQVQLVKHFGRHLHAEVRTALELGQPPGFDGLVCTCGCGGRYGIHIDHRDPRANGGPTVLDNLQPLVGPEHRFKTERDRVNGLC
jgi:hypothetical protein